LSNDASSIRSISFHFAKRSLKGWTICSTKNLRCWLLAPATMIRTIGWVRTCTITQEGLGPARPQRNRCQTRSSANRRQTSELLSNVTRSVRVIHEDRFQQGGWHDGILINETLVSRLYDCESAQTWLGHQQRDDEPTLQCCTRELGLTSTDGQPVMRSPGLNAPDGPTQNFSVLRVCGGTGIATRYCHANQFLRRPGVLPPDDCLERRG